MKNRLLILSLLALAMVFSACSGSSSEGSAAAGKENTEASASSADSALNAGPLQDVTVPGNDNSEIVTSQDAYGIRTDTRTFKDHPSLASLVIRTLADGSRVGYAIGKNGGKVFLHDHQFSGALDATADELASITGFNKEKSSERNETVPAGQSSQPAMEPLPVMPNPAFNPVPVQATEPINREPNPQPDAAKQAEAEKTKRLQKELSRMSLGPAGN